MQTSIEANKAHFDWIDNEKREKGQYDKVFTKIINGIETEITETTTIGRDFVIIKFERVYNPALEYIRINTLY